MMAAKNNIVLLFLIILLETGTGRRLCPSGQLARYVQTPYRRFADAPVVIVESAGKDNCTSLCTTNQLPGDEACTAAVYDIAKRTCSLFSDIVFKVSSDDHVALEKVCFTDVLVSKCDDVLNSLSSSVLLGRSRAVTTESNVNKCIRTCLISSKVFGFHCKSVNYFPREQTMNCVLNDQNRKEARNLMASVETDVAAFYEFDCETIPNNTNNRNAPLFALSRSEWSAWSPCHQQTQRKLRVRNCQSWVPSTCEVEEGPCFEIRDLLVKLSGNKLPGGMPLRSDKDRGQSFSTRCSPYLTLQGTADCKLPGYMFVEGLRVHCRPDECKKAS